LGGAVPTESPEMVAAQGLVPNVYVGEEGPSLQLRTNGRFGSIRPSATPSATAAICAFLPLLEPPGMPASGRGRPIAERITIVLKGR
jgi:hypothetical protein